MRETSMTLGLSNLIHTFIYFYIIWDWTEKRPWDLSGKTWTYYPYYPWLIHQQRWLTMAGFERNHFPVAMRLAWIVKRLSMTLLEGCIRTLSWVVYKLYQVRTLLWLSSRQRNSQKPLLFCDLCPKASEVLRDSKSKDSWWSTLEECETHVVNANKTSSWGCNATNAIKCGTLVFQFPCWPAMASLFLKNLGRFYLCIISTLPLLTLCQLSITFQKPSSPKITEIAPRFWSSWWSTSPKHVWIQSENLAKICLNR